MTAARREVRATSLTERMSRYDDRDDSHVCCTGCNDRGARRVTLAIATTLVEPNQPNRFLLAADARTVFTDLRGKEDSSQTADVAIKTYSLGQRVGAVGAGDGLSIMTAAEMTRGVVATHEAHALAVSGQGASAVDFFNTVRLFSYFLDRIDRERNFAARCDVAVAGFWNNGFPGIARVTTRQHRTTRTAFWGHRRAGSLISVVGRDTARERVVDALKASLAGGESRWLERVLAAIQYCVDIEGETSVGGGVSVAYCELAGSIVWPWVITGGRKFLRGFELTSSVPGIPSGALQVDVDRSWHAASEIVQRPEASESDAVGMAFDVEEWVPAAKLFEFVPEPAEVAKVPVLDLPPEVQWVRMRRGKTPAI
jgi:hypothetical protein